jgi:phosphatidylserine/phosphatidylglycerophosphate/cardiolipin synthase-like enzyme
VTLEVTTEIAGDAPPDGDGIRHDVFFNRGVIGSQAYAREFGNREPDAENPRSKEMRWLSRGLFEALVRFIGLAGDGMALRAALYEFHYQPVANAFTKAIETGANVKIVYDAESNYKVENEATIKTARLDDHDAVIPRTVTEGIRHNKFIVLLNGSTPVAVWTGSTNISAGGIFGHSNVGHVVWDEDVARKYLGYWQRLAANLTPNKPAARIRQPRRHPAESRPRILSAHCSPRATTRKATRHSSGMPTSSPKPNRSPA